MATTKGPHRHDVDVDGLRDVNIYRKMPVATIQVSNHGNMAIESAVLVELAEVVHRSRDENGGGSITDAFEFVYGDHRVQVNLGDATLT